jgi:hypothetical protein
VAKSFMVYDVNKSLIALYFTNPLGAAAPDEKGDKFSLDSCGLLD